jgi:UDPglucose 6-dehydrogenase
MNGLVYGKYILRTIFTMKISVIGTGYVGLVTAACLADMGNDVIGLDIDLKKVQDLRQGVMPIHEAGLEALVTRNMQSGRLSFTTEFAHAVPGAQLVFIAVGTPSDEDGSADLSHVLAAARSVAQAADSDLVIVNKSTVPVGTADKVRTVVQEVISSRGLRLAIDVVSNPEFLKEGCAVNDFLRPDRIIVGAESAKAIELMRQLYAPFSRNHEKLVVMDTRSAELTKYASNAAISALGRIFCMPVLVLVAPVSPRTCVP